MAGVAPPKPRTICALHEETNPSHDLAGMEPRQIRVVRRHGWIAWHDRGAARHARHAKEHLAVLAIVELAWHRRRRQVEHALDPGVADPIVMREQVIAGHEPHDATLDVRAPLAGVLLD